eukprot:c18535_g1_i1.p1 GENE.c18535_g1_i1~~c18535_g1_i1.p1  ORF type:complete len:523 (+),score=241.71 c18535_g1_i1:38-1570(+)
MTSTSTSTSTNTTITTMKSITNYKTKIVCTLGPASCTKEKLVDMVRAGMDVVRLNFSHGKEDEMRRIFSLVREISSEFSEHVAIMCDIQGPKIRVGLIQEPFSVKSGDIIRVTPDNQGFVGNPNRISIQYATMLTDLTTNDFIFINDGIIRLVVTDKDENDLICRVEAGGVISTHKGCNIPSGNISLNVITEKDVKDIKLIAELNPEFLAASFIGTADDVRKVRAELAKNNNYQTKIVSKIERPIAIENIDDIISVTDAVMVARGDLGVEIPAFDVPHVQKTIVKKCNRAGKPVIVATQMLESMIDNGRPTRAEASDVFNACLDGADAVMLSGETSVGKYVVEAVKYMDEIVGCAEKHFIPRNPDDFDSIDQSLAEISGHGVHSLASKFVAMKLTGKIVTLTTTGITTRMVSKYRPPLPIVAVTESIRTAREVCLVWGAHSLLIPHFQKESQEQKWARAVREAVSRKLLDEEKDHVICISASELSEPPACDIGVVCGIYRVKTMLKSSAQ